MNKYFFLITLLLCSTLLFSQTKATESRSVQNDSISLFHEIESLRFKLNQAETAAHNANYFRFRDQLIAILKQYNLNSESIELAQRSLQYAQKIKDTNQIIEGYRLIGNVYLVLSDFKNSKNYIHKANTINQKYPNYSNKELLYQNNIVLALQTVSDDFLHYNQLLHQYALEKDQSLLIDVYNNYFAYYYKKYTTTFDIKYKELIRPQIEAALQLALASNDYQNTANVYNNMAVYYEVIENDAKKSIYYYKMAIDFLESKPEFTENQQYQSAAENYSFALFRDEQYKLAADYALRSLEVQSAVYDSDIKQKINEIETKFLLDNQKKVHESEQQEIARKHRFTNYIYIIALLFCCIAIILIYMYFQNRRLAQENRIQLLKREKQEEILVATMDAQNDERHRIASVLHDHVSALLASATMQLQAYLLTSDQTPKNVELAMKSLASSHQKVRDLSHELVPVILTKFGLTKAVADLCESFTTEQIKFECDSSIPNHRFTHEFELKVFYMISELMNNALRHSKAQDVSVHLWISNQVLNIIVSDNGIGMPQELMNNEGGIGMLQLRARIKNLNGKLQIENNDPGAHFEIQLPLPA